MQKKTIAGGNGFKKNQVVGIMVFRVVALPV